MNQTANIIGEFRKGIAAAVASVALVGETYQLHGAAQHWAQLATAVGGTLITILAPNGPITKIAADVEDMGVGLTDELKEIEAPAPAPTPDETKAAVLKAEWERRVTEAERVFAIAKDALEQVKADGAPLVAVASSVPAALAQSEGQTQPEPVPTPDATALIAATPEQLAQVNAAVSALPPVTPQV